MERSQFLLLHPCLLLLVCAYSTESVDVLSMLTYLHLAENDIHVGFLRLALEEAKKCEPTPTAFCVGCVITSSSGADKETILSTGYSRELSGNTHAEANALAKLHSSSESANEVLRNASVYTTMEPCSIRTSGLAPCADALIAAKVKRCFIGVGEPADFVTCEGATKLKDAGIEVIWLDGLESECLEVARRGHT